ncbi:hypothetical protein [Flagellimonas algicola]|uniref:DUF3953 domain-containing protein n=1 Tax=Flagellimonas algicola TaxID=2583815 RepID=A0ABY2WLU2_9FLAO|nr:hypothetical protein [Allomuricauda algicola]TMU55491.1 hypothetical protein FGG15_15090 [Allomuricauda algicola]
MRNKNTYIHLTIIVLLNSCTEGEPEGVSFAFTVVLGIIFVIAAFRTMFTEGDNKIASGIVGIICLIASLLILA